MRRTSIVLFVIIILVMASGVIGCSSGVKDEKAYVAPKNETPAQSSQVTPAGGDQSSVATNVPAVTANENGPSSTDRKLIMDLISASKQGKVPGCDFVAGKTNYEPVVVDQWGKPNSVDYLAPKGRYAVYSSRRITLGVNKGELLFEVRSFENQYKELTRADLTSVLGKPDSLRYYKDTSVQQDILVYNVSPDYHLIFVLPQANKNNPEPHVDHISVVSPKDAINMMAS
ncbi:MAG: YjgB family protein [Ignavibacteriales bacterium]